MAEYFIRLSNMQLVLSTEISMNLLWDRLWDRITARSTGSTKLRIINLLEQKLEMHQGSFISEESPSPLQTNFCTEYLVFVKNQIFLSKLKQNAAIKTKVFHQNSSFLFFSFKWDFLVGCMGKSNGDIFH